MMKAFTIFSLLIILEIGLYSQSQYSNLYSKADSIAIKPVLLNLDLIKKRIGYPQLAREMIIQGTTIFQVKFATDGKYISHRLVSGPLPVLSMWIENFLPSLEFTPAYNSDGTPVEFYCNLPFGFVLLGDEKETSLPDKMAKITDIGFEKYQNGDFVNALRSFLVAQTDGFTYLPAKIMVGICMSKMGKKNTLLKFEEILEDSKYFVRDNYDIKANFQMEKSLQILKVLLEELDEGKIKTISSEILKNLESK